jgi:hypothetical protein
MNCRELQVGWPRLGRFLLASAVASILSACGGGGGGGGQPQPTPGPDQAVERSSGLAVSTITGLSVVIAGVPGAQPGGAAATGGLDTGGWRGVQAGAVTAVGELVAGNSGIASAADEDAAGGGAAECDSCPDGGSVCGSCDQHGSNYTLSGSFSNCKIFDSSSGSTLVLGGGLAVTAADPSVCEGVIPSDTAVTIQLSKFSAQVRDAQGHTESVSANLTETITPSGYGCAPINGTMSLNGSLGVTSQAEGVDVSVNAQNLTLTLTSSGVPCVTQILANGGLGVTDRLNARSLSEGFDNLRVTVADQSDSSVLSTIDGGLSATCIGNLTLQTLQSIRIPAGGQCPTGGVIAVQRDDGASGHIRFNAGGSVVIHYGDGTPDKTAASCRDASLSQCE